ncbi:MAG TPA: transcriptional regulator [Firmicutes bacterium]|jgi:ArsR family transcriptional regulator|nr:transcriptional regulator [Bacillota bacterium]
MQPNYSKYALMMKSLSDETRVEIFAMLSAGELCAREILEEFQITQPTLSYHMKILSESGLVNSRRDGVWMKYSINREHLEMIQQFLDGIDARIEKQSQCCELN